MSRPEGLPDEIANDPLFNQKYGEAVQEAERTGQPIDLKALKTEALAGFQKDKDQEAEAAAGEAAAQAPAELAKALKGSELLMQNPEMAKVVGLLTAVLEQQLKSQGKPEQEIQQNLKGKENLLMLFLAILMMMVGGAAETLKK
ncbi:hypothetical protein M1615_04760 [Patescibacteria group bacterium]|nr:hypothetical protein [Patescibacteria group bacterium]MCL5010130.1 hypothetical protein [Patescibacteria group bacterium]